MRDTPRTDAVQHGSAAGSFFAMMDHAQQLERENQILLAAIEYAYEEQNRQGWVSAECFDRLRQARAMANNKDSRAKGVG